jgi:hypothetical protein
LWLRLWCADERTLILGFRAEHFASIPDRPARGVEALVEPLRAVIQERMSPGGPLWAVLHTDDWALPVLKLLLAELKVEDEDLKRLKRVRTLALWVQVDPQVTVRGVCAARDEDSARKLEKRYLMRWQKKRTGLTSSRDREWLTLQWKTDLETLGKALGS